MDFDEADEPGGTLDLLKMSWNFAWFLIICIGMGKCTVEMKL